MIPEIVRGLAYRKGPYFASEGDFSSAGAVYLDAVDRLEKSFAQVEIGSFGHRRAVTGMSAPVGLDGTVLVAGEAVRFDGPWDRPDELRKLNGDHALLPRHLRQRLRADRHGLLRPLVRDRPGPAPRHRGGPSSAATATSTPPTAASPTATASPPAGTRRPAEAATRVYRLRHQERPRSSSTTSPISSSNPVDGDQFKQPDDRWIGGAKASRTHFFAGPAGLRNEMTVGLETRYDAITVGLFKTKERQTLSTVREDDVREASVGVFGEATLRWTPWLRTIAGLRADLYTAEVAGTLPGIPAAPATRSSAPRPASCSAPGPGPSSTSTPAPAFTATTRAAPSPRSIP